VPVISAVGHEVDFTIADFVADVRAATPSNAAELVVERADHFLTRIDRALDRLRMTVRAGIERQRQRAGRCAIGLRHFPTAIVLRDRDCDEWRLRLDHAMADRLARARERTATVDRRLARRDVRRVAAEWRARLIGAESRLRHRVTTVRAAALARVREAAARLDALSPLAVLGRGYAVCWNEPRTSIIRSARAVAPGDRVRVTLAEGELACRVEPADPN
jgi:exodeoxyribonuclease VII large subunit